MALVVSDAPEAWPYLEDVTAGFLYVRMHGSEGSPTYHGRYAREALDQLAAKVDRWSQGGEPQDAERVHPERAPKRARRDVYVFFDNSEKVHAPYDALALAERLGLDTHGGDLSPPPGRRDGEAGA